MEKISLVSHTKVEELLHIIKEERNALHTIKRRKYNYICHTFCRNYLLNIL